MGAVKIPPSQNFDMTWFKGSGPGRREWYDSHKNLSTLLDWLGDMPPSSFRHAIEKPWNYEDEFKTATAAVDHEVTTRHTVNKDGDTVAYCNDCEWRHEAVQS